MSISLQQPLSPNFSQDFLPERRLLSSLLHYAQTGAVGDKLAISGETGIPTGKSTGKVEPIIHYAHGMGLVVADKQKGEWHFRVTPVGACILDEDPHLNEALTLWLLHLTISRRCGLMAPAQGIADPWFALFAEGTYRLGSPFTLDQYVEQLQERYGSKGYIKGLSGLVLRNYLESSCFGNIEVLQVDETTHETKYRTLSAPVERSYFPVYTVYLFGLWDEMFPAETQMGLDEFFEQTYFLSLTKWSHVDATPWLEWMVDQRLVQLDRHTGRPLILRLNTTDNIVRLLYSELL